MTIAAGKYDIYLDEANAKAWFVNDGSYPGGGAAPEASEWGVVGQINSWGGSADIVMYKTATEGLFVAYKVDMPEGPFKIRANNEWNDEKNYGLATAGNVEVDHAYDVITSGGSGNMTVAAGTYDIWFDLTNSKVYIMTPGKPISEAVGGEAVVPDPTEQAWYMVGNFNNWNPADEAYKMTAEAEYFVFKNFVAASGCEAKFAPGAWNGDKGISGAFAANTACTTGGTNIPVAAGTYDVYLAKDLSKFYFMTPGYTPGQTPSTPEPEEPEQPEQPEQPAQDNNLYLKPNSNWKVDGARFAAYFFGNGEKWVSMTDSDGDGYYEVEKQAGYPNVIFCRMNPNATANNWNNKWNQISDLTVPTDGKNCYTVAEGTWDNGGGTWSTK